MQRTKNNLTTLIIALSCSVLWGQWGAAPGAITEEGENSQIDYSTRMIKATGIGAVPTNAANVGVARANAIRAAKMDALRNLVEAVKDVRITSETTVSNNMVESDVITSKVEAMIRGAQQVGDVKYLSDSSVELTMEVPLSGIMDLVMPTGEATAPPELGQPPAAAEGTTSSVTTATPGQPITGLIIDARGLGIKPSMSPQVLTDDGTVLYGPGNYPREFAVAQGVVGYHKDPTAAAADARVVGNPVTIKGLSTSGGMATDVVIALADAQRVAGMDGFGEALSACRVMFILD
ncbi:MAG: LPP20 family lipoprotein [Candidatus Marinimicrobia bacterium]|nr:LPP20 family lipoprotein [Candidatus Neomarinimicrobiota bacterium]